MSALLCHAVATDAADVLPLYYIFLSRLSLRLIDAIRQALR